MHEIAKSNEIKFMNSGKFYLVNLLTVCIFESFPFQISEKNSLIKCIIIIR